MLCSVKIRGAPPSQFGRLTGGKPAGIAAGVSDAAGYNVVEFTCRSATPLSQRPRLYGIACQPDGRLTNEH